MAYYGWSDAGFDLQGNPLPHRIAYLEALGDLGVAIVVVVAALLLHVAWRRRGV
ncbi:MAG: hypothetical protein ACXW5U_29285 [Thermoanaerobaculia bacterium]